MLSLIAIDNVQFSSLFPDAGFAYQCEMPFHVFPLILLDVLATHRRTPRKRTERNKSWVATRRQTFIMIEPAHAGRLDHPFSNRPQLIRVVIRHRSPIPRRGHWRHLADGQEDLGQASMGRGQGMAIRAGRAYRIRQRLSNQPALFIEPALIKDEVITVISFGLLGKTDRGQDFYRFRRSSLKCGVGDSRIYGTFAFGLRRTHAFAAGPADKLESKSVLIFLVERPDQTALAEINFRNATTVSLLESLTFLTVSATAGILSFNRRSSSSLDRLSKSTPAHPLSPNTDLMGYLLNSSSANQRTG